MSSHRSEENTPNLSGDREKGQGDSAEARRAGLRASCRPSFEAPLPTGIAIFGWVMTAVGLAAALGCLVFLFISLYQLLNHRPLAGEHLLAAGVGLAFALFYARLWHGFCRLPDWRVARDVPLRTKVFSATGSALSASLAAGALALLTFVICAKETFLDLMQEVGAADVGKVQVLLSSVVAFFFFLLLWSLFQAMMELREWARTALGMVFAGTTVLAFAGVMVDASVLSKALGNHGVTAVCAFAGGLSLVALVLELILTSGEDVARHFRANER